MTLRFQVTLPGTDRPLNKTCREGTHSAALRAKALNPQHAPAGLWPRQAAPGASHSPVPREWLKSPFTTRQVLPSPLQTPHRSSLAAEPMMPSQPIF